MKIKHYIQREAQSSIVPKSHLKHSKAFLLQSYHLNNVCKYAYISDLAGLCGKPAILALWGTEDENHQVWAQYGQLNNLETLSQK